MITKAVIAGRRIIQDMAENEVSVIGILEDFIAQGFPLVLSRVSIVWIMDREENEQDEFQGALRVSVDGEVLGETQFSAFFKEKRTARVVLTIAGFLCPKPGTYLFDIIVAGQSKGSTGFHAELAPPVDGAPPVQVPPSGAFMVA